MLPTEVKSLDINDSKSKLTFDKGAMSATGILCTNMRDREGDIVEPDGVDFIEHQWNPIVLLDHGVFYHLPIGKTVDNNGLYMVKHDGDIITQTTYFSQHSEMAEQVYSLYCEGMLCGNSLRIIPLEVTMLPPDPLNGKPRGKHVFKSMLQEVTWSCLPANASCISTLLDTGLNGKALRPELKSMLAIYKEPKKVWAQGAHIMNKTDEMSSVDEANGGAMRNPVDEAKSMDEPVGAAIMRKCHIMYKDAIEYHHEHFPKMEDCPAKKYLEKHLKCMYKSAMDVQEHFKEHYKDAKPLEELEYPNTNEEAREQIDAESPEVKEKMKSLIREVLAEEVDVLTADEEEEIKKLEKAIERREKIIMRAK